MIGLLLGTSRNDAYRDRSDATGRWAAGEQAERMYGISPELPISLCVENTTGYSKEIVGPPTPVDVRACVLTCELVNAGDAVFEDC